MLSKLIPSVLDAAQPVVDVDIVTAVAVRSVLAADGCPVMVPDMDQLPVNLVEAFKRVIHRQLLEDLRAVAMQREPDQNRLRSLLASAERCRLDPVQFPQVRVARNRARQPHGSGSWMPGARLADLVRQLQTMVPDVDINQLLATLPNEALQQGRSIAETESTL